MFLQSDFDYFCKMESTRQQKISKLLLKDLGEIFQMNIKEITGSYCMVTVTKVNITKDLSQAKIFLSIFGTADKDDILKKIRISTKFIRKTLAERVRHQLRIIPELVFGIDDSLDYIENIDKLLSEE